MDTLDGRHFITKLLLVAGKNIILVLCDRLSKMEYFMATTKGILVEGLAQYYTEKCFFMKRHSLIRFPNTQDLFKGFSRKT